MRWRKHSQWMSDNNQFDHNEGTVTPGDRATAAGYPANAAGSENISSYFNGGATDLAGIVLLEHNQLFVDAGIAGRGHRTGMLNPGVNEIGAGVVQGSTNTLVTENFGNARAGSFLTGIAYSDFNQNNFYEPGEELPGVTITATRVSDNAVFSTASWSSGGYTLKLDPGTYMVTVSGGNIGTPAAQSVTITSQNVEADFTSTGSTTPAAPVVRTNPVTQSVNAGATATFTVGATGTPLPSVQWQSAPQNGTFTDIAGATGFAYSVNATNDLSGTQYRAVLTNPQGQVTSAPRSFLSMAFRLRSRFSRSIKQSTPGTR